MTVVTLTPLALPDAEHAAEWMRSYAESGIARARVLVDELRTEPPSDTLGALRLWDEMSLQLGNVAALGSLLGNVHPDEEVRTTAETAEQDVMRLLTELSLDRGLYEVFAGLSLRGARCAGGPAARQGRA